jgi:2,3-bisphosphoglycerate-independent phosphoglycerate mutase
MKYVVLHAGGLAGRSCAELGSKTLLQAAATPALDRVARAGELGQIAFPTDGCPHEVECLQMALLGYAPKKQYPGLASLEAAGLGVAVGEQDIVFRCWMVTFRTGAQPGKDFDLKKLTPQLLMDDATAGGISSEESRELIDAINEQLGSEAIQFYPGAGHRHLMVWVDGKPRITCHDPYLATGKPIGPLLPTGEGADVLKKLMEATIIILRDHPVNEQRRGDRLKPANCLWLWGPGRAVHWPNFAERRKLSGAILSTSDVMRGVGVCAGLEAVDPAEFHAGDGALFSGVVPSALRELQRKDFLYCFLDMPTGPEPAGAVGEQAKGIEAFDRQVVDPLLQGLAKLGPHRLLVIGDYLRTALAPGSPFPSAPAVLYDAKSSQPTDGSRRLTEADAAQASPVGWDAAKVMARFLGQS